MIRFNQVYKRYPNGFDALKNISLFIPQGSITFLTGHSGAGKSTLLRLMSLAEVSTRGQVMVNDLDLAKLRGNKIARHRRSVGFVFQDHKLLPDRTVQDNVALPLIVAGVSDRECKSRARAALDKVALLDKANRYPVSLSSGEQQRVGIARAVVGRPEILLADEPTGNLDPELANEIMKLFFMFNQLDVTVLIATHDTRHLADDRAGVVELSDGQIISSRHP
ncbi:MAG: ATP-binding cassette domain-containing protein [Gammaproteobacteria bacterium]|nr:ATP-binding cassette domain-containing protein [Gammaproteobacteria bacterium]